MVDLGTLGGTSSAARAINNLGQVTGWSYLAGNSIWRAFRWAPWGPMVDLGTLGGDYSLGYGDQ